MKNNELNQFYSEGFTFQVPRKLTSFLSKSKVRTFAITPPTFWTFWQITKSIIKADFQDLEIEDFEVLSKKDLRKAAYIVAIAYNSLTILRPFYALYFYTHIEAGKLGKLSYMVRLLNDTNATLYTLAHMEEYIYSGISQLERDAIAGKGLLW